MGDMRIESVLRKHLDDPNPEISESCEVALDMLYFSQTLMLLKPTGEGSHSKTYSPTQ